MFNKMSKKKKGVKRGRGKGLQKSGASSMVAIGVNVHLDRVARGYAIICKGPVWLEVRPTQMEVDPTPA